MEMSLKEYLASDRVLIADGATGTMLMAAGLPPGAAPEVWNVEAPAQVMALHQTYLEAGSQIVLSNSFGGSPLKLAKYGLQERAVELNHAAASLARQAVGDRAYVAGDIGPTGELMEPLGTLTPETAFEAFKAQAAALVEGGVDALWIETMSDLEEARAAVLAAKQVTHLPVFCSLSFGPKSRTMMGVSARRAAAELWPLGLAAVGANCGEGLDMIPEVLRQMSEAVPDAVLIAKPNAGLPRIVGKETIYDVGPMDFAQQMQGFIALGARVVGSCCGSNPEYIRALTAALAGRS